MEQLLTLRSPKNRAVIGWTQSTGMVGGVLAIVVSVLGALGAALQQIPVCTEGTLTPCVPGWLNIIALVLPAALGSIGGGWVVTRRMAKGRDPGHPEPRVRVSPRTTTLLLSAVVALVAVSGCGVFVRSVACPVGAPPTARVLPATMAGADGVVVGACGDVEVERWTCGEEARLVCDAAPPYVLCRDDGGERRLVIDDPDGVTCAETCAESENVP